MNRFSPRRALTALSDGADAVATWTTIVTTIAFTLLIFVAVVTRYAFRVSLVFSVEISKLLFVWSAFLAATVAYKRKAHIRFEFINMILGPRGTALTDVALYLSAIIFFQMLFRHAIRFTRIIWRTYLPVLGLSQGWLYVAVVVSSALFFVHSSALLAQAITDAQAAFSRDGGSA